MVSCNSHSSFLRYRFALVKVILSQTAPEDLANICLGQGLSKFNLPRNLIPGELPSAPLYQFGLGQIILLFYNKKLDALA